ncbi:unnamed protein product [Heterobilharzia americana]|nr:unnamed protein product [Heterobilharzia americana]
MSDSMNICTFTERNEETFEDYTAVTDWEAFTQELENLLISWIIKQDIETSSDCGRVHFCGSLKFGERVFRLSYYKCDEVEKDKNSTSDGRKLVRVITSMSNFSHRFGIPLFWFGLSHAFLLQPEDGEIKGGTRLSLLLSSIEMAVYATRCPIPVLVEHYGYTYFGLVASCGLKSSDYVQNSRSGGSSINSSLTSSSSSWIGSLNIDFTSCRIESDILATCTHLGGLKEIFLSKLVCFHHCWLSLSVNYSVPKLDISARFLYHLPSCSSIQTKYSHVNSFIFSFDLLQESSLNLSFNLATIWPIVPSHAITERPSWKSLKPEGAPIWQLQICSSSPFTDKLSVRILRFLKGCSMSEKAVRPADFSSDSVLSSDSVVQFLLFLFPDADAENLCNNVLRGDWNRKHHVSHLDVQTFAAYFGLPNPCSLIHRLAIIITNLFVYKNYEFNECLLLIKSMFNELYIELKLRFDRLICLPPSSLYEGVYNKVISSPTSDPLGKLSSLLENRSYLKSWNQNAMISAEESKFSDWLVDVHYSLDFILHRFNACIFKAREGYQHSSSDTSTVPSDNIRNDNNADDEDGDAFFDAYDECSPSMHEATLSIKNPLGWIPVVTKMDAMSEAGSILVWFKTRSLTDHFHSLLPNIILECILTFHSLVPHPRLSQWYSSKLTKLDGQVYDLLKIHSPKSMGSEDTSSMFRKSFFPLQTFREVLQLIAQFSIELTCLNELICNVVMSDCSYMLQSDIFLNFLCQLSEHVNLLQDFTGESKSWTSSLGGWIDLPTSNASASTATAANVGENERNMILTFLKRLFDKSAPTEIVGTDTGQFNFSSIAQTWISPIRPVDLRRPDFEMYTFYTELACPNPLTSRIGPHRLFIELQCDKQQSNYTHLLMAGSFSQDTQFF